MSAAGPLDLLQLALPVFLVIGAGLFLRRAGILTAQADASMLGMLMKLFLPCLAFDAIMGNEALTRAGTALVPPLAGFLLEACCSEPSANGLLRALVPAGRGERP